jgi:hypothetical protein
MSNSSFSLRSHETKLCGPVPAMWVSIHWFGSPALTPPLASTASLLTTAAGTE